MNLAIFASAFHPSLGGVEEVVRQLSHEQQRRGDRPLILTNRWPKSLPSEEEYEGLPVRRYVFRVPEPNWRQMGGAVLYRPAALRRVVNDLRRHQAELLHIHCVSSNAYYALLAKRRLRLPLVVTLHGELTMDAGHLFQRSKFAQGLLRDVLAQAEVITACSARTLEEAERFFGQPFGSRARVILNGANLDESDRLEPYQHARPYILAMGRHVRQKGFDVLLQAMVAWLRTGVCGHDLLIAGDGPERGNLEQQSRDLGVVDRVHFPGRVDHVGAIRLFKGCDFFVLPSRADEGLPMVVLEAMAARKAVVASRVGGVAELVRDGETGVLLAREDAEALAAALQSLAASPELHAAWGAAGRRHVECLSWANIAGQYAEAYQDALALTKPVGLYCGTCGLNSDEPANSLHDL